MGKSKRVALTQHRQEKKILAPVAFFLYNERRSVCPSWDRFQRGKTLRGSVADRASQGPSLGRFGREWQHVCGFGASSLFKRFRSFDDFGHFYEGRRRVGLWLAQNGGRGQPPRQGPR